MREDQLSWCFEVSAVQQMEGGEMRLRADLRELRIKEAAERTAYWRGLSVAEKLASLDARLGAGVGATRQRKLFAPKEAK